MVWVNVPVLCMPFASTLPAFYSQIFHSGSLLQEESGQSDLLVACGLLFLRVCQGNSRTHRSWQKDWLAGAHPLQHD
jgi:hypothetical protein